MPSRPSPDAATALYTREFWTVWAAHLFLGLGFWMFVVLPLDLVARGATDVWVGTMMALQPTSAVLVRPALGRILSVRGRRWTLRSAGAVNLVAVGGYALVDDIGLGLALVRLLQGIGIGALFTSFITFAADISPVERRTEGLSVFGISGLLPTALAPILGEEIALRLGFDALYATAALFSLVSLAFTWALSEPPFEPAPAVHGFWRVGRDRRRWPVWATAFLFSLGMSSFLVFLVPFVHEQGLSRVGPFFFCYSLAAVSLRLFGRRIPDRVGPQRMLVPALATLAVGLYLVSRLDSFETLAAAGFCCGLGHGYLFPILSGLAIRDTNRHERGAAMSFFTGVFDLAQVAGPPAFGLLAERVGYGWTFFAASLGVASALSMWVPHLFGERRR